MEYWDNENDAVELFLKMFDACMKDSDVMGGEKN
jgi:hypothetical protein